MNVLEIILKEAVSAIVALVVVARTLNLYPFPAGVPEGINPLMDGIKKSFISEINLGAAKLPLASDNSRINLLLRANMPFNLTCTETEDPGQ